MRLLVAPTVAAALGLAAAAPALADTLKVPSETYPTIQSAVVAAADGDTVSVAPGTYGESVAVMDKTNLVIRGRARPVLNGPGPAFSVTGGSGVTITGFQIEGGGGAIFANATSGLVVSKVTVVAPTMTSFDFLQCAGVTLTRCQVSDGTGTVVQDATSTGLRVEKCRILNHAAGDVMLISPTAGGTSGSTGAVVSKNRIEGGTSGIRLGGQGALVEKNRMTVTVNGIVLDGVTSSTGTTVSKNRIQGSGGADGIQVNESGVTIQGNTLTAAGLFVAGDDAFIDRNRILVALDYGIQASGTNLVLTRNQVLVAAGDGIYAGGNAAVVGGNRVVGVDGHGIVMDDTATDSQVLGNRVTASDGYGILVLATPVAVSGNRASGNGQADYGDANAEGVNTLTNNRFRTLDFDVVF
ncbi:MAG TPA: right-handed parallel beta-helix repeat-containing protein [Planctomycetota bacterium]|nr:right-handed parallel beta-helix repeat-containing protein [Planctomycetota bacterium]